jgi:pimeloyl-ACP methyl ester carboxylesterase
VADSEENSGLDLVYTVSEIHGALFAEREVARRVAQIWRAVEGSTTWGEFRAAMSATDWSDLSSYGRTGMGAISLFEEPAKAPKGFGWLRHCRSGRAPQPSADFDVDDCAEAATDVLGAVGVLKPVDWLGNAWGGHVGLMLAAKLPDWCRSVTTISTPVQALSRCQRMTTVPMVWAYRYLGAVPALASAVAAASSARNSCSRGPMTPPP